MDELKKLEAEKLVDDIKYKKEVWCARAQKEGVKF